LIKGRRRLVAAASLLFGGSWLVVLHSRSYTVQMIDMAATPTQEFEKLIGDRIETLGAVIGRQIGRPASTVSREVARNGGRELYRCESADAAAYRRAKRPKECKLAVQEALKQAVAAKLELKWSPEQISNWLPLAYPDEPEMRVSHETIYLTLFVQSRGALNRELQRCLRSGRAMRYPKAKRLSQQRARLKTWF
jgi:IS30 family transposase